MGGTLTPGYAKIWSYVDGKGNLDARFAAKSFQGFVATNSSAHTDQLLSIRAMLSIIPYRGRLFGVMEVPRAFLKSVTLGGAIYSKPLHGYGRNNPRDVGSFETVICDKGIAKIVILR